MAINWYSHHIGDYDKKTKHLTILEHGCYRLLLDYFYSNGGPFPDDKEKIYRIVRAQNGAERRAVDRCLCQFFELTHDSLWNQTRASEEISKYNEIKEIRKNIGAIGGANSAAKRQAKSNPPTPTPTPTPTPISIPVHTVAVVAAAAEKKFNGENLKKLNGEAVSLSDDWVIPDEWGIEMEKLGIFSRDEIVLEGKKFFNHWKPKEARPVSAWLKHWRNWFNVAEEKKNGIRSGQKQGHRKERH